MLLLGGCSNRARQSTRALNFSLASTDYFINNFIDLVRDNYIVANILQWAEKRRNQLSLGVGIAIGSSMMIRYCNNINEPNISSVHSVIRNFTRDQVSLYIAFRCTKNR